MMSGQTRMRQFTTAELAGLAGGLRPEEAVEGMDRAEVVAALAREILEFRNARRFVRQLAEEARSKGEEILTLGEVIEQQGREIGRLQMAKTERLRARHWAAGRG